MRAAAATAGVAAPFALRLGGVARRVPDARVLDRLIRGRTWIAIVAVLLLGIVFMQVSMLKLNTGISHSIATQTALERQNSVLRAQLSQLDSGARIQDVAEQAGMLMPPAGQVRFLGARTADAVAAADNLRPPSPVTPSAPVVQATSAATTSTTAATTTTTAGTPAGTTGAAATTSQQQATATPTTTTTAATTTSTPASTGTSTSSGPTATTPTGGVVAGGGQ
ncbi:MAG TPA: hypothetical protein VFT42_00915 [Solirubrobacteraceae bacterium]|nr:hypothetical protein [Solirubrobacteraceae bacterium]